MAGRKIQFRRGLGINTPQFDVAELGFTTDDKCLFIGSDTGNIEIAKKAELDSVSTSVDAQLADNAAQSEKAGLSGWLRDLQFNRNKKICCVGDSTTDNTTAAMYLWNTIINNYTGSGDSLEGITLVNHGHNGNTLLNYLATGTTEVINEQADMYIFSYGINDVRVGVSNQQQIIDMLDTAIQQLLKQTKGYILLRMPNSFLTDDVGAFGFVSPLASAQAYTDILYNAYMYFKNKYPRVDVLDTQTLLFGRVCTTLALNPLMDNQIHPSSGIGYPRLGRLIANEIGVRIPTRDDLITDAQSKNLTKPYLVYPRALESGSYDEIANGYLIGIGTNYLDLAWDGTRADEIIGGDILRIGDGIVYELSQYVSSNASALNTRLGNMTFTGYASVVKGMVRIYRKKVKPNLAFIGQGTNINGQTIGMLVAPYRKKISTLAVNAAVGNYPYAFTLRLFKDTTQTLEIATINFSANNGVGTVVWNTTNFPLSNVVLDQLDILSLVCIATTSTLSHIFTVSLS